MVKVETEAPAPGRKPSATATPSTLDKRASPRLYRLEAPVRTRAAGHRAPSCASSAPAAGAGGTDCLASRRMALPPPRWKAQACWKVPYEALEDVGIQPYLLHAQHVNQVRGRKTDAKDRLWLARICQFGLALPSCVSPRAFRQLRQLSRYRRKLVSERRRLRPDRP